MPASLCVCVCVCGHRLSLGLSPVGWVPVVVYFSPSSGSRSLICNVGGRSSLSGIWQIPAVQVPRFEALHESSSDSSWGDNIG